MVDSSTSKPVFWGLMLCGRTVFWVLCGSNMFGFFCAVFNRNMHFSHKALIKDFSVESLDLKSQELTLNSPHNFSSLSFQSSVPPVAQHEGIFVSETQYFLRKINPFSVSKVLKVIFFVLQAFLVS